MSHPLRCLMIAAVLALAPASAALAQRAQQAPSGRIDRSLAGLPIYTSDGKAIGTVIAVGLDDDNKPVLVGEIARSLGFGPTAVAVPLDMFVRKGDRIELTLTAGEVNAKLGRK